MKVSVIVPVHNGERWIGECLASIEAQTYRDFEVVCVDDGSTDSTPQLLAQAAATHPYLRVVTQPCRGVSAARNAGLAQATGTYVLFVDADDLLRPQLLERAVATAEPLDAQMTDFGFDEHYAERNVDLPREMCAQEDLLGRAFTLRDLRDPSTHLLTPNVWRILLNRAFLEQHALRFHEDLATSEDLAFIYEALLVCDRIALVNERLYRYRRDGGTTLTRADRGLDGYTALSRIADKACALNLLDDPAIARHLAVLLVDTADYAMYSCAQAPEYRRLFEAFKQQWLPFALEHFDLLPDRHRVIVQTVDANDALGYLFFLLTLFRADAERLRVAVNDLSAQQAAEQPSLPRRACRKARRFVGRVKRFLARKLRQIVGKDGNE